MPSALHSGSKVADLRHCVIEAGLAAHGKDAEPAYKGQTEYVSIVASASMPLPASATRTGKVVHISLDIVAMRCASCQESFMWTMPAPNTDCIYIYMYMYVCYIGVQFRGCNACCSRQGWYDASTAQSLLTDLSSSSVNGGFALAAS